MAPSRAYLNGNTGVQLALFWPARCLTGDVSTAAADRAGQAERGDTVLHDIERGRTIGG